MGRAPCCDRNNVKKGPWSPEEDAKLKAYMEEHGTGGNWIALPQKIGLRRCGKSCRLRWLNYLRPNIRHGGFSEEEDNLICSLYISIGSRWSIIAAQLPGRTDNDIKNYWNTKLKKKLLGKTGKGSSKISQQALTSEPLSTSAMERMQLHMKFQELGSPFFSNGAPPLPWPKSQTFDQTTTQAVAPGSEQGSNHQVTDLVSGSKEQDLGEGSFSSTFPSLDGDMDFGENIWANSMADKASGLLDEALNGMVFGKNSCSFPDSDLDAKRCFDGHGITFDEKSPSSSWSSSSIFHDYASGCGI